jgi:hypothetical protein
MTKKRILKAISKINESGIPKNAYSSTYNVVWEGKRYPPTSKSNH